MYPVNSLKDVDAESESKNQENDAAFSPSSLVSVRTLKEMTIEIDTKSEIEINPNDMESSNNSPKATRSIENLMDTLAIEEIPDDRLEHSFDDRLSTVLENDCSSYVSGSSSFEAFEKQIAEEEQTLQRLSLKPKIGSPFAAILTSPARSKAVADMDAHLSPSEVRNDLFDANVSSVGEAYLVDKNSIYRKGELEKDLQQSFHKMNPKCNSIMAEGDIVGEIHNSEPPEKATNEILDSSKERACFDSWKSTSLDSITSSHPVPCNDDSGLSEECEISFKHEGNDVLNGTDDFDKAENCSHGNNEEKPMDPPVTLPSSLECLSDVSRQESHIDTKDKTKDDTKFLADCDDSIESIDDVDNLGSFNTTWSEISPIKENDAKSTIKATRKTPPSSHFNLTNVGKALDFDDQVTTSSSPRFSHNTLQRTPKAAAWLAKHNMLTSRNDENLRNNAVVNSSKKDNESHFMISKSPLRDISLKSADPTTGLIKFVSNKEYDDAPRIVKMQVTLVQVNQATSLLNNWWLEMSREENSVRVSEEEAREILSDSFPARKVKGVLCSLCHWKKMTIEPGESGTSRTFVSI